jgi:hypothetical protein
MKNKYLKTGLFFIAMVQDPYRPCYHRLKARYYDVNIIIVDGNSHLVRNIV